jgi:hypothetical protein
LAFTDAVIVESSTYWPAVWPVIEVHPAKESESASASAAEIRMGLSVFMANSSFDF